LDTTVELTNNNFEINRSINSKWANFFFRCATIAIELKNNISLLSRSIISKWGNFLFVPVLHLVSAMSFKFRFNILPFTPVLPGYFLPSGCPTKILLCSSLTEVLLASHKEKLCRYQV
jgi:hypothetical protein